MGECLFKEKALPLFPLSKTFSENFFGWRRTKNSPAEGGCGDRVTTKLISTQRSVGSLQKGVAEGDGGECGERGHCDRQAKM